MKTLNRSSEILGKVHRGIKKPPHIIVRRIFQILRDECSRYTEPLRARKLNLKRLLSLTESNSLNELWNKLAKRPYFCQTDFQSPELFNRICPGVYEVILKKADWALHKQVNLLGSGLLDLGNIDWLKDYKTGHRWPKKYMRDIDYRNPDRPSDVKFPWELSRMQWMMPLGQAYLLTHNERYAEHVKSLIIHWIDENPYAYTINWACTMEVALRLFTWTWFFHVFHSSAAWNDDTFRSLFLCNLFLHAEFTENHLELSDINGNHYTADAAGLCISGLFFGEGRAAQRWAHRGFDLLVKELPRQVFNDGVDFEASTAYHRLVLELFLFPALYRGSLGFSIPPSYRERIVRMAYYMRAYSRNDGTIPLCGDADDARVLPFGIQDINDHRYLYQGVGLKWGIDDLIETNLAQSELYWLVGAQVLEHSKKNTHQSPTSQAFTEGGFYIMRNHSDHIFIDCGPIGLGGRGGHGHNDCLSFEAMLDDVLLISDCGSYVYTASYEQRNLFRSTSFHNTPKIDHEEINRFVRWDYLWSFHKDSVPQVIRWKTTPKYDLFCGSHSGYQRLKHPIIPRRTITLQHELHQLRVQDEFIGNGEHVYEIPLHLAMGVEAHLLENRDWVLRAQGKTFLLSWQNKAHWDVRIEEARISPSYGVVVPTWKLLWTRKGTPTNLSVIIKPMNIY